MAVTAEAHAQIIPELARDEIIRQRAAEFIGSVATGQCVEAPTNVEPIESLYAAIQLAEAGDERARAMVEVNARTDAIERTMKAGHVMSVDLMVDETNRIQQHGQSLDSVQANSLRFAADIQQMRQRVEAETRNSFRLQDLYDQGDLKDHYFVVLSRAADNMAESEMDKVGFFTDTMSCAIQVTSLQNGRLVMESAFVAGVERPGGERYDKAAVTRVAERLGADYSGFNAAQVLDRPMRVPKSMMPNGAVDLVKIWDEVKGTFFGQAKPRQDYQEYLRVCHEREKRFEPKIQGIVNELISEASSIKNPLMATRRLNKLSAEHMLQQAMGDDDIDPGVFGPVSARDIYKGRQAIHDGRPDEAMYYYREALKHDTSRSCPGGVGSGDEEAARNSEGGTNDETCTFISKSCPKCNKKNVRTTVTANSIRGDCGCHVSI